MKYITLTRAKEIAGNWHGGQWSALYQFASSGEFHIPNTLQYFKELFREIEAEYFEAREVSRTQKDLTELNSLVNYLRKKALEKGVGIEFGKSGYGYTVPYLMESVSADLEKQVKPVTYLK